jgi:hypothetical protein
MNRQLAKRIQQTEGVTKEGWEGGEFQEEPDVLSFEQPNAAQKFSAQEFLKADRSA